MPSIDGCGVVVVDDHGKQLEELANVSSQTGDEETSKAACIQVQHGKPFSVRIKFRRDRFKLQGADGVKVVISCGHEWPRYGNLRNTQAWYLPKAALYGTHTFSNFSTWDSLGTANADLPLTVPEPASKEERDRADKDWNTSYFANRGSIAICIHRGFLNGEEEKRKTYRTDPPSSLRKTIKNKRSVIRYDWFRWSAEADTLYAFEFQNLDPGYLSGGVYSDVAYYSSTFGDVLGGSDESADEFDEEDELDNDDDSSDDGKHSYDNGSSSSSSSSIDSGESDEGDKSSSSDDDDREITLIGDSDEDEDEGEEEEGPPSKRQRFSAPSKSKEKLFMSAQKQAQFGCSYTEYDDEPEMPPQTDYLGGGDNAMKEEISRTPSPRPSTSRPPQTASPHHDSPAESRKSLLVCFPLKAETSSRDEDKEAMDIDPKGDDNSLEKDPVWLQLKLDEHIVEREIAALEVTRYSDKHKPGLFDDPKHIELRLIFSDHHAKIERLMVDMYVAKQPTKTVQDFEDDLQLIDLRIAAGEAEYQQATIQGLLFQAKSQKKSRSPKEDVEFIELQLACGRKELSNAKLKVRRCQMAKQGNLDTDDEYYNLRQARNKIEAANARLNTALYVAMKKLSI